MFFLFQCHALISDGSLALCTALEQFNLVYLKNKLYEGKLPYWLPLKWTADWLLLWWVERWLREVSCAVVTASEGCGFVTALAPPLAPPWSRTFVRGQTWWSTRTSTLSFFLFFRGGGGGQGVTSIFLTFLFMIVRRTYSTCKGLRNYCDHPYLLVKTGTLYRFFNARKVDY